MTNKTIYPPVQSRSVDLAETLFDNELLQPNFPQFLHKSVKKSV